jgi:DNA-directed RNA polymerase subunit M/transcription elongation factor TFIIS
MGVCLGINEQGFKMAILYCAKCGSMIPPGGIDGEYFEKTDHVVCGNCYKKQNAKDRTGDTALRDPANERRAARKVKRLSGKRNQTTRTQVRSASRSGVSGRLKSKKGSKSGISPAVVVLLVLVLVGLLGFGIYVYFG